MSHFSGIREDFFPRGGCRSCYFAIIEYLLKIITKKVIINYFSLPVQSYHSTGLGSITTY
jgi:hypothetical protein